MTAIYKANELKTEDITYNEPRLNNHGGLSVALSYNNQKITIQTPKARIPFGLNTLTTDDGSVRKSIDISFAGLEENQALQDLYNFIRELDDRTIDEATKNSEKFFKKKMSREVVQELYKPLINDKSEGKYPATLRMKMMTNDQGHYTGSVFNAVDKTKVTEEMLTKGSHMAAIVSVQNLWVVNKLCGLTLKVEQIKVWPKPSLNEYAFDDSDDEEAEKVETTSDPEAVEN